MSLDIDGSVTDDDRENYRRALEDLWDMLSDCVEGGRLTESDLPDDYRALVLKMQECETRRAKATDPE